MYTSPIGVIQVSDLVQIRQMAQGHYHRSSIDDKSNKIK